MSSLDERNMVMQQEFGEEMAGQRVGWVGITNRSQKTEDCINLHLVSTTIGAEGARIQYETREEEGETIVLRGWHDAVEGFVDTAALTMMVDLREEPTDQHHREARWSLGENAAQAIQKAADGHNRDEDLDASRIWLPNASLLMPTLKDLLTKRGRERYYPLVYYTANMVVAHESFRGWAQGVIHEEDAEKLMLSDAAMADTTKEQIATAEGIAGAFAEQIGEDERMKLNLSAFVEVPADELPDSFVASRRVVGSAEKRAIDLKGQLLTYVGVYLPNGAAIGAGRTWPYMDASETSEDKAFGAELRQLGQRREEPVQSELKMELAELESRHEYAERGLSVLRLLSGLESTGS